MREERKRKKNSNNHPEGCLREANKMVRRHSVTLHSDTQVMLRALGQDEHNERLEENSGPGFAH